MALKLVVISDTHNHDLTKLRLPEGDLLIHCGDWTGMGTIPELSKVNEELASIKGRYTHGVLGTAGNHDWLMETNPSLAKEIMSNVKLLMHDSHEIEGIRIFLTAWQPHFCNWAFNILMSDELEAKYKQIPDDTQLLITHCPPLGILDDNPRGRTCGSGVLLKQIPRLKNLKLHCFGHIHNSAGQMKKDGVHYINAATCDENYEPTNAPIVYHYNVDKSK